MSASEKVPAAQSAEYSPSEWPATKDTLDLRSRPRACMTRMTAIDTAINAGWALAVSVKVSSGPSNMVFESFSPSASSTSAKTAFASA